MSKRDYYEVLGVSRESDRSEIKKAFKTAARKFHPDRNPGDEEAERQFKEASEAYEVLQDAEKRSIYDRFGHDGLSGSGYRGVGDIGDIFGGLGDIFSEFFGGSRQRQRRNGPVRGSDIRVITSIPLVDAVLGCEQELELSHPTACDPCQGTGGERDSCGVCQGAGQVVQQRGMFMMQSPCPQCRGLGSTIKVACEGCGGSGEVQTDRKVRVTIPAGVDSGQTLRLSNQGQAGRLGGPPGHLYVVVDVAEDERFERHGDDLVHGLQVSFSDAALGAQLEVPNIDPEGEPIRVRVPAGAQPGQLLRVRDAGVPRLGRHGRGDLVAVVELEVPKKLSRKAKKLIEELRDELS